MKARDEFIGAGLLVKPQRLPTFVRYSLRASTTIFLGFGPFVIGYPT